MKKEPSLTLKIKETGADELWRKKNKVIVKEETK